MHELAAPVSASEDFGSFGTEWGVPSVFWYVGGTDPDTYRKAEQAGRVAAGHPDQPQPDVRARHPPHARDRRAGHHRRRARRARLTRVVSLDRLVNEAAERITRLDAPAACSAARAGGVIIDIRSQDARERHGVIPGSVHIPRTVLEWRVALDSPWRNPHLGGLEQQLILVCDHGYSSILAAGNLVQLGIRPGR